MISADELNRIQDRNKDKLDFASLIAEIRESQARIRQLIESNNNEIDKRRSAEAATGYRAMQFLKKLAVNGGRIVSSGKLSRATIVSAQACGHFFVDEDGLGYAWLPEGMAAEPEPPKHQVVKPGAR